MIIEHVATHFSSKVHACLGQWNFAAIYGKSNDCFQSFIKKTEWFISLTQHRHVQTCALSEWCIFCHEAAANPSIKSSIWSWTAASFHFSCPFWSQQVICPAENRSRRERKDCLQHSHLSRTLYDLLRDLTRRQEWQQLEAECFHYIELSSWFY